MEETSEAPWLDLLDPLTELILERLPLLDYLRFGAVCRKWRSIQRAHRLRHSPGPPPMPCPHPWLVPYYLNYLNIDLSLHCYSPVDRSLHRFRLPSTAVSHHRCLACAHGWMFLLHLKDLSLSLLNPITAAQIHLPPLYHALLRHFDATGAGAMSAPPTHPDCTVLLLGCNECYVLKLNNRGPHAWIQVHLLHLPHLHPPALGTSVVFSGDTFYCAESFLYAVDPRPQTPTVRLLDMDCSQVPQEGEVDDHLPELGWVHLGTVHHLLAELGGEILLVVARLLDVMEFQVFRADISGGVWVRVHTLGDRSLFLHECCSFSLLAADVGCKKNCIYYPKMYNWLESCFSVELVHVFDFETGRTTCEDPEPELDLSHFSTHFSRLDEMIWHMPHVLYGICIMPRLDLVNPGEVLFLNQQ